MVHALRKHRLSHIYLLSDDLLIVDVRGTNIWTVFNSLLCAQIGTRKPEDESGNCERLEFFCCKVASFAVDSKCPTS